MKPLAHRRAYRMARVALLMARILPAYLILLARERTPWPASPDAWNRVHERTAARVDALASSLGGLFIKLGQIIGARADVFPAPFVERMRRYHDALPPRPFAELRPLLEATLGAALESRFERVDEEALAAASIAQVHRARLRSGEEVVLKIQYPEIAAIAPVDLGTARRVARLVAALSGLDVRSLAGEVTRFIALELDFEREVRSTLRAARALSGDERIRVPAVYDKLCGKKLIVLEYLDGVPLSDVPALRAAGHDPADVAARVGRLYAAMIFRHGFFHGDPHPGNLLVLADGSLGLIDFGLCKELGPEFAASAGRMIRCGLSGDGAGALEAARCLGFEVGAVSPQVAATLIGLLLGRAVPDGAGALPLLTGGAMQRIPEDFALVARTLVLLNGLAHGLAPGATTLRDALAAELGAA